MTTMMLDMLDINDILARPVQLANTAYGPIDAATIEEAQGFDDIKQRFADGFEAFVRSKKYKAAIEALKNELGQNPLAQSETLVTAVFERIEDEALIETPYVFIALNPRRMI